MAKALILFLLAFPASQALGQPAPAAINDLLESVRQRHRMPAMAGAIVTSKGLVAQGAAGVRKAGTDVKVTVDDKWHLGSETKAMTATLIGSLEEQGRLNHRPVERRARRARAIEAVHLQEAAHARRRWRLRTGMDRDPARLGRRRRAHPRRQQHPELLRRLDGAARGLRGPRLHQPGRRPCRQGHR